jgi:hypothetical protein
VPYIIDFTIDFTMVDTNKDATIDANEFKAGCAAGWIAPASLASSTVIDVLHI